jgi:hypothetical protein
MKKALLTTFDRLMAAAAFAEEGEHETAREFLREEECDDKQPAGIPEMSIHQPVQTLRS